MLRSGCRFLSRQLQFKRLVVLAFVGWLVGLYWYAAHLTEVDLQRAVADTDVAEPGWQLDDWRWGRSAGAEQTSGQQALLTACAAVVPDWADQHVLELLSLTAPQEQLSDPVLANLQEKLKRTAPALTEGRKLADLPPTAVRQPWSPPWKANLEVTQQIRALCTVLALDALERAHRGDSAGALISCRAALRACQGIEGTSLGMGFLVRVAARDLSLRAIESTLAVRQVSDDDLAGLQRELASEEREPALTNALCGERASMHWAFVSMESGELPMSAAYRIEFGQNATRLPPVAGVYDRLGIPMLQYVHAWMLRYYTQLIAVSRAPAALQPAQLVQLQTTLFANRFTVPPAANFMLFSPQLFVSSQRGLARVRTSLLALEVERHRARTGAWPAALADLEVAPWPAAWTDPYDGQPLRYRRVADGVVLYALGPDLQDNQGKFDRKQNVAGTDIGVRLWDVAQRGVSK